MVLKVLLLLFLKHKFAFCGNKDWENCTNSYECLSDCCADITGTLYLPICLPNNRDNKICIGKNA